MHGPTTEEHKRRLRYHRRDQALPRTAPSALHTHPALLPRTISTTVLIAVHTEKSTCGKAIPVWWSYLEAPPHPSPLLPPPRDYEKGHNRSPTHSFHTYFSPCNVILRRVTSWGQSELQRSIRAFQADRLRGSGRKTRGRMQKER